MSEVLIVAFRAGLAFSEGLHYSRTGLALDAKDEDVEFRTTENGHVVAIKDGKVVGGAGLSVGPDNVPTFESFDSTSNQSLSFTKRVKTYVEKFICPVVQSLSYPKGMPPDCARIQMEKPQVRELVSHLNSDKVKALPYVGQVYREGTYRTAEDQKHKGSFDLVVYTSARVLIGKEEFDIEVITKRREPGQKGERYVQYGLSKADKVEAEDSGSIYQLVDLKIEKPQRRSTAPEAGVY